MREGFTEGNDTRIAFIPLVYPWHQGWGMYSLGLLVEDVGKAAVTGAFTRVKSLPTRLGNREY